MKKVISGAQAVAEAVKLCKPGVIAAYPITPQTPVMETICQFVADGEINAELIRVESEHSAMAACIGSQATGVRSYTATASQGLKLMSEMLFVASGMRLPIVMTVANRALSAPLNIWNDQSDSFAERDSGWIQLYVESAQEAFDTQMQAFKIAEETLTPVMVCMDGYVLSHTYEPVKLLEPGLVERFLPPYKPPVSLNPAKPATMGPVGDPQYYMIFKKQQQDALEKAPEVIRAVNREFASLSGRAWGNGLIEKVGLEGKSHAIITIGSVTGTARELADKLEIGIIKVKSLRPFPAEELRQACSGLESIGVIEKDISFGANGALYDEVKAALYTLDTRPKVSGFIAGLGGRDITLKDMESVMKKIKAGKEGTEWVM
ncbi:MAG: pyruvate ferredoxin oxidoreductase [Candidatus Aenigmatarchaeota archaeon]